MLGRTSCTGQDDRTSCSYRAADEISGATAMGVRQKSLDLGAGQLLGVVAKHLSVGLASVMLVLLTVQSVPSKMSVSGLVLLFSRKTASSKRLALEPSTLVVVVNRQLASALVSRLPAGRAANGCEAF